MCTWSSWLKRWLNIAAQVKAAVSFQIALQIGSDVATVNADPKLCYILTDSKCLPPHTICLLERNGQVEKDLLQVLLLLILQVLLLLLNSVQFRSA